jgi:hypothetical protein
MIRDTQDALVFLLACGAVLAMGCAVHRSAAIDPDRVFQYGQLQLEGDRFVLVEQSLESGEVRDLLVMDDVPDTVRVCFEVPGREHREMCHTLGVIRQVLGDVK